MSKDSTTNIIVVAITLCLVCSVIVSTAAVKLRPAQEKNKILDQKINILKVSGLWQESADIESLFSSIETRLINLNTGEIANDIDVVGFDQRKASKDAQLSIELDDAVDIANINRRSNYAKIFLVKENNKIDRYVFPVHGYGLWSTLYGYVTLEKDMNTIYALKFYDHRETPGLGGEVDNVKWQDLWKGKRLFDSDNKLALTVVKGAVIPGSEKEIYQVDGLSGATLTSDGVTNMFRFWMGEHGFKKFMNKVRAGES
ncbi:MAG: Na(+)-translocating NADH-quinone reductase subunit C [Gammaproteobacteria bacterium]